MIISEQCQVETDEQGNPVAYHYIKPRFHKLRSFRIHGHPRPSIVSAPKQILESMINSNSIQYMPAKVENQKTHKPSTLEIILFLVVLVTLAALIVDFVKPFKQN